MFPKLFGSPSKDNLVPLISFQKQFSSVPLLRKTLPIYGSEFTWENNEFNYAVGGVYIKEQIDMTEQDFLLLETQAFLFQIHECNIHF